MKPAVILPRLFADFPHIADGPQFWPSLSHLSHLSLSLSYASAAHYFIVFCMVCIVHRMRRLFFPQPVDPAVSKIQVPSLTLLLRLITSKPQTDCLHTWYFPFLLTTAHSWQSRYQIGKISFLCFRRSDFSLIGSPIITWQHGVSNQEAVSGICPHNTFNCGLSYASLDTLSSIRGRSVPIPQSNSGQTVNSSFNCLPKLRGMSGLRSSVIALPDLSTSYPHPGNTEFRSLFSARTLFLLSLTPSFPLLFHTIISVQSFLLLWILWLLR